MGSRVNKHLLTLAGRPVLAHTLEAFQRCSIITDIVLVGGNDRLAAYERIVNEYGITKVCAIVHGGATRQESSARGLAQAHAADIVCVHDGARPLVSERMIVASVQQAAEHGAAIVAVPAKDTIKMGTAEGVVQSTLERERLWQVQTPQAFRADLLRRAQREAGAEFIATDDAALVERLGLPVRIVTGDYSNIKITTADDLAIAEYLLQQITPRG
jgi:2-C-methyl-D-erythritol 4-phosphate cytidylyltransferase